MLEADKTSNDGYSIFAVNVAGLSGYRERKRFSSSCPEGPGPR